MRFHEILRTDVEAVVAQPAQIGVDRYGNPRLSGFDHSHRAIIVVVASDDLDFVITTFPDD
jgi:hypothetical protein